MDAGLCAPGVFVKHGWKGGRPIWAAIAGNAVRIAALVCEPDVTPAMCSWLIPKDVQSRPATYLP